MVSGFDPWDEAYTDEEEKFYLSHKGPVPVPIESAVTHDSSVLAKPHPGSNQASFLTCMLLRW